ncbi:PEP/pyruvate-binding domain-containing protein [uncultured Desulfobacter sp.]|uniref:PEP/pyruvate-binding domain-containing protein n=1 Tax=uncultured Desulfobacter sp. TaxID=240139 RepID=UPI002AA5F135|nr:PEP/pyruvate-binding domain-containing protein [uncultured Desulfobacter sp.]
MLIKNLFRHWTYQVFAPGTVVREKYEAFKRLLGHDRAVHELLAVLEDLYYNQRRVDLEFVVRTYEAFSAAVADMIQELLAMCPNGYWSLKDYHKKFDFYVRFMLAPPKFDFSPPFILPLDQDLCLDEEIAGGKAAVLARLKQELLLPVPQGFVITTRAFHYFMEANDLYPYVRQQLAGLDIDDPASLTDTAQNLENAVLAAPLPEDVVREIDEGLTRFERVDAGLERGCGPFKLAMRSSGVMEDGDVSFAGQYLSLMNVDMDDVEQSYKRVIAGKYSPAALAYRIRSGIPDHNTPMAVLVLEMIEARSAGVIYTRDVNGRDPDCLKIYSAWGLGGAVVDGRVTPDMIQVDQNGGITSIRTGAKNSTLVPDAEQGTCMADTIHAKRRALSIGTAEIVTLNKWARKVESYFKTPQDMEWCLSPKRELYLLQARPLKAREPAKKNQPAFSPDLSPICRGGQIICPGKAAGPLFKLNRLEQLKDIPEHAVVAAAFGLPQYAAAIHRMAGIILRTGSTAGHFASIAREFGLPAIICSQGFDALESGNMVTLDADAGRVYPGQISSLLSPSPGPSDPDGFSKSILMEKLEFIIRFCADLKLTDPGSKDFTPDACRSMHDIIRFVHETAVKEMFFLGQRKGSRKKGARQLISGLPMLFYVLDVGSGAEAGLCAEPATKSMLDLADLVCIPLKALFKGLAHPDICWDEATHFDWESYDKIVMAGGIISPDSPQFGSYAVVSRNYMNLNLRFGYHFVILDCICTQSKEENYILFRFSGGGGNSGGRWRRAAFISGVLEKIGFVTQITADLIDGRIIEVDEIRLKEVMDLTGRLLGATKLMDMYLKEEADVEEYVTAFMNGQYDFRSFIGE